MDELARALDAFDAAPTDQDAAVTPVLLAARKAVAHWRKRVLNESEHDDWAALGSKVGLNILKKRNVAFSDGHTYPTAMHCFQAQKACDSMKAAFEVCALDQALTMGRSCPIDVTAWDANRKKLMTEILRMQVEQHDDLKDAVRDHGDDYVEDVMKGDLFWSATLPDIWNLLHDEVTKPKKRPRKE